MYTGFRTFTFTLEDVFLKNMSEKNMKKLLTHCSSNTNLPLRTVITIGDVALCCGIHDAWWCTRILPRDVRFNIIKAALPSFKRVFNRLTKDTKTDLINEAILFLEKLITNEFFSKTNIEKLSLELGKEDRHSFSNALSLLMKVAYETDYVDDLIRSMYILDMYLRESERQEQVNDICSVFKPLRSVQQTPVLVK